jgi:hypothetical protein
VRIVLAIVGGILSLDALVTVLMIVSWLARGHVPDFVNATLFGIWSMASFAAKSIAGPIAAVLLWRSKELGRRIAAVLMANNVAFTIAAAARAGAFNGTVLATLGLHAAMLVAVLLPAAAEACREPRRAVPSPASARPVRR